jgi:hypothetical protein
MGSELQQRRDELSAERGLRITQWLPRPAHSGTAFMGLPFSGSSVVGHYELFDLNDQLFDAGEAAATDGTLRDDCEPALHLIQPGSVGGRVMHVETRPLRQPGLDLGILVRTVVIDDEEQLQIPGHFVVVDATQKAEELLMTIPRLALRDHRTGHHIEGSEQGGGAMADGVMGHAFDVAQAHRQQRLGAV